jgi:hypothetical protein
MNWRIDEHHVSRQKAFEVVMKGYLLDQVEIVMARWCESEGREEDFAESAGYRDEVRCRKDIM